MHCGKRLRMAPAKTRLATRLRLSISPICASCRSRRALDLLNVIGCEGDLAGRAAHVNRDVAYLLPNLHSDVVSGRT